MNLLAVLSKTAKGAEEIATRKYKLYQRTRALLIVVNGKSTATEILKKFEQMPDVAQKMEFLLSGGFVAETAAAAQSAAAVAPSAAFEAARAQLARAMLDALGPAGDGITEKIEACRSAQELKDYIDTRRANLEAALGRRGEPFWRKAKELLG